MPDIVTAETNKNDVPKLSSYPTARPYLFAFVCFLLFWLALSWLFANAMFAVKEDEYIAKNTVLAGAITKTVKEKMMVGFTLSQSLTKMLSNNRFMIAMFSRPHFNPSAKEDLSRGNTLLSRKNSATQLEDANNALKRLAHNIETVESAVLLDKNGNCIASSEDDNHIGKRFSDYYDQLQPESSSVRYAVGQYSNRAGVYFSAPVLINGQQVGTVITKVRTNVLFLWPGENKGLVIDRYGVIISSTESSHILQVLPTATVYSLTEQERLLRYGQTTFNILTFKLPQKDFAVYRPNDDITPEYVFSEPLPNNNFILATAIQKYSQKESFWIIAAYFALSFFIGFAFIALILYLCYTIQYHRVAVGNRMKKLTHRDSLTGLYNRSMLLPLLAQQISIPNNRFAVAFMDLDRFKEVNDCFGHEIGDEILQEVARRFSSVMKENHILVRHAGDDFVLIISNAKEKEIVETIKEFLFLCQQPFYLHNDTIVTLSVSIGIAYFPDHGNTASMLLRQADTALYHVKQNGRNNYAFYAPIMSSDLIMRKSLENDMEKALTNNEFFLVYQPQYSYNQNGIVGCEALIRWKHPTHGIVSPVTFIPIAESSGFIHRLSNWILSEACRQASEWHRSGMNLSVAVNLSSLQFSCELPKHISHLIHEHKLKPGILKVELTESILMRNVSQSQEIIQDLRNMDIAIHLDDFGTGYSSLAYLQKFTIDTLKIDRSFISDMESNLNSCSIVKAIISIANGLNYEVVAEGIETPEQYNMLKEMGCHIIQGYYFSKPLPADQFANFYAKNRPQTDK